jgi:hypothetical protein
MKRQHDTTEETLFMPGVLLPHDVLALIVIGMKEMGALARTCSDWMRFMTSPQMVHHFFLPRQQEPNYYGNVDETLRDLPRWLFFTLPAHFINTPKLEWINYESKARFESGGQVFHTGSNVLWHFLGKPKHWQPGDEDIWVSDPGLQRHEQSDLDIIYKTCDAEHPERAADRFDLTMVQMGFLLDNSPPVFYMTPLAAYALKYRAFIVVLRPFDLFYADMNERDKWTDIKLDQRTHQLLVALYETHSNQGYHQKNYKNFEECFFCHRQLIWRQSVDPEMTPTLFHDMNNYLPPDPALHREALQTYRASEKIPFEADFVLRWFDRVKKYRERFIDWPTTHYVTNPNLETDKLYDNTEDWLPEL